jgi:hypothetical protein
MEGILATAGMTKDSWVTYCKGDMIVGGKKASRTDWLKWFRGRPYDEMKLLLHWSAKIMRGETSGSEYY